MSTMIQHSVKVPSLVNRVDSFKIECSTLDQDLKINSLKLNGKLLFSLDRNINNRHIDEHKILLLEEVKELLSFYGIDLEEGKKYSLIFDKMVLQLVDEDRLTLFPLPKHKYLSCFSKINESCSSIYDRLHIENISTITASDKIKQLDAKANTIPWKTAMLVGFFVIGFFALSIGIGSFYGSVLPSIGAHVNASLGIVGMPLGATIGLLSFGAVSLVGYLVLRLNLAKKSKQMNEYFKDIHLKNREWFLPSNINDLTNGILLILTAVTAITTLVLLKGSLAYPAGILMVGSGLLQLKESINALKNARKVKDFSDTAMSILKIIYSGVVIGLGVCTLTGFMGYTMPFYFLVGGISITLSLKGFLDANKQRNEVNKIDANDPVQIMKYLEKNLSLSKVKINKLKTTIYSYNERDVQTWLDGKSKNFSEEKIESFKTAKSLEEKQKMILNEEIQLAIEKKIQRFGSIVRKDTLKQAIELVNKHDINLTDERLQEDLIKLFAKVKQEIISKRKVELFKIFALYVPFTIAPALGMAFQNIELFEKIYYLTIGSLTLVNFMTNLDPRRRNIPPTDENKDTNINDRLTPREESLEDDSSHEEEPLVSSSSTA